MKDVPTRRDVARHGARNIYKLMGKHLNLSRKKCKSAFFEFLEFFMVPWADCGVSVDQKQLSFRWGFPDFELRSGRLQDISDTKTKSSGDVNLNEHNLKLLSEIYGARQDMILIISHEVHFIESSGSSKKKRNRSTKRVTHKAFKIVEVAAKFCAEFVQGSDSERSSLPFIQDHKDALRCVIGIAILFRELKSEFMAKNCINGRVSDVNNMEVSGIMCGDLSLSELIPGRSSQVRSLSGTVLRMKENIYSKLNVSASPRENVARDRVGEGGRQGVQEVSGNEIQASHPTAVFAI